MRAKYNYLVTGVKIYPVTEFLEWEGEAYTSNQAVYFFRKEHGYKGVRDVRPIRGTMVVDENQTKLSIG